MLHEFIFFVDNNTVSAFKKVLEQIESNSALREISLFDIAPPPKEKNK
jgi:hypothetical protein